jgi:myo-inositol-1(or 4)-monophosphatase
MTSQVGVVYQPLGQKLYYAELGKGAFLNGAPISVSGKSNPAEAILLINHGYRQSDMERCVAVIQRLGPQYETRKFGATALELAWLAQGLADAFLCSGDELWDYAAGMLLIREAGGQVTDWRGHHFNGESSYMCASNGIFHSQLVNAVHDLQP